MLVFKSLEPMHGSIGIESRDETDPGKILVHTGKGNKPIQLNDPKCHTVYFLKDRRILFSKTYAELGIDTSKPFPGDFIETNLQPILEKMIRENVTNGEIKTEEVNQ